MTESPTLEKCPICNSRFSNIGCIGNTPEGATYTEYCSNRDCSFERIVPIEFKGLLEHLEFESACH